MPVGKGQTFLNQGGVLDAVFGGWHLGGIITFRSGFPFANPTPNLWFNVNDFPVPNCAAGCFGNASR
ncbi:MAG TPA: hypothetical protein VEI49_02905 [Terriglobales bacterium]|nr:hypothetical protein [Terriglobales bacterium]